MNTRAPVATRGSAMADLRILKAMRPRCNASPRLIIALVVLSACTEQAPARAKYGTEPTVWIDSARATVCYIASSGISCVPLHPITLNVTNTQAPK